MSGDSDERPADEETFRRPNDHLVEPFFAGLERDAEETEDGRSSEERSGPRGWLARFVARVMGRRQRAD